MTRAVWCISILTLAFIMQSCNNDNSENIFPQHPTTLLISMDGFRHDYLMAASTPHIDRFAAEGVATEGLRPVFPSKTFPNHYSIVTGLYPEEHGIVANQMVDSTFGEVFRIGAGSAATREGKWFEGEPIWVTAELQGVRTATFFWPGSDAEIKGVRPSLRQTYDNTIPYESRIAQVINWLSLPNAERPRFISLYFESPDKEGHLYGPDGDLTIAAVESMDRYFGDLLNRIEGLGLSDFVDVILLSDHGMSQLSRDRVIFLDDYLDLDSIRIVNWSPNADIFALGSLESTFQKLKDAHPRLSVYRKDSMPEDLHYQRHHRIAPIIAVADDGWTITSRKIFAENPRAFLGGNHGYHPSYESMWAIFMAKGPSFRSGVTMEAFDNIHIYELLCHLLEIRPATNSGSLATFQGILLPQ